MKMSLELGAVGARAREAANEEFAEVPAYEKLVTAPVFGWDPYEVWRTRVKDESELPERGTRTA